MILRFRTKQGMFRVNVDPNSSFADAVASLSEQLPAHAGLKVAATPSSDPSGPSPEWQKSLASLGLKHGEMLFATYDEPIDLTEDVSDLKTAAELLAAPDPLDQQLAADPGKIARPKSAMCQHGDKGMCEHCQPLEPWDEEYCTERGIKHHSFYAHLKKLQSDAPSAARHVLEELNYSVNPTCTTGHAPWPDGQCSKCQPSAITLQQQTWRTVDHVEFANAEIVNGFIEYWRSTNTQRFGILMGIYDRYDKLPLGVKAVIHAIYEPPQTNVSDGLKFDWVLDPATLRAAAALGLKPVGVIFTDLTDSGNRDGTVLNKRHLGTYYLSSLEIVMAATLQVQFPFKTTYAMSGEFSSRFVTCVVSGNSEGQIDMACYQVSSQAEAMVRAKFLEASSNPAVMRIRPSTRDRFVPEVFYKHFNEYGLAVRSNAKPSFPNDYLLVSLTHGFPDSASSTVLERNFPTENRPNLRRQTPAQLAQSVASVARNPKSLRDFHLLRYLLFQNHLDMDEYKLLCQALEELGSETEHGNRLTAAVQSLVQAPGMRKCAQLV